jgi:hypothetical protein
MGGCSAPSSSSTAALGWRLQLGQRIDGSGAIQI